MRSRYSAYALRLVDYLLYSHHPRQHGKNEREKVKQAAEAVSFYRLEILSLALGQTEDKIGKVEFKAFYRQGDEGECIHENSRFKRYQGRWVYWDGEMQD
jgi:SEC-C motif-containing protein